MLRTKDKFAIIGGCWAYKSGLRIFVRVPEMPFWACKDGHFWQKCPCLDTKKWHFQCPNENSETTFISLTSPKNGEFDFSSEHLLLLDRLSANSKYAK